MIIGSYDHFTDRRITYPPPGVIDDPFEGLLIVVVNGKPQIGHQILYLFTLIE